MRLSTLTSGIHYVRESIMLDFSDIKSAVLSCAITAAVGGGIYGLYFKHLAPAAFSEVSAYELVGKCFEFTLNKAMIPNRRQEIELFLKSVHQKLPEISKADAVATTMAAAAGTGNMQAGMGTPLEMCIDDLKNSLENASK
jgi:Na+/alanine symporter